MIWSIKIQLNLKITSSNPNAKKHIPFTMEEVKKLWELKIIDRKDLYPQGNKRAFGSHK